MLKIKKTVLMLSFILSGVFCYAHDVARAEKRTEEGTPIEIIEKAVYGGMDKSNSILPTLDGHVLTVVFTENLGQVAVDVTTALGAPVDGTLPAKRKTNEF